MFESVVVIEAGHRGAVREPHSPAEGLYLRRFTRNTVVRLYGTTKNSRGIAITSGDEILIRPSGRTAKIIRLGYDRTT